MDSVINLTKEKMEASIVNMQKKFSNVRAGRANPSILDGVMVNYYGMPTPLIQLATISIPEARQMGIQKTVQGNLDPALLLSSWDVIEDRTKRILDQGMEQDGYIFNLGHGVFPSVNPETLKRLTAFIHEYSSKMK